MILVRNASASIVPAPLLLLFALLAPGDAAGQARPREVSSYLDVDSVSELYVKEIGTGGEPVVVLHGGPGGDYTHVLGMSDGLTGEFHWVFYDQRGSIRSYAPEHTISMAAHVADLEKLRQALGAPRMKLVSHSAGTMLAYEYLKAFPERVSNVVLVGALPYRNGEKYMDAEYAKWYADLPAQLKAFENRAEVQAEIARVRADTTLTPEKRQALVNLVGQWNQLYHVERWRAQEPVRVSGRAGRLTRTSTNWEFDYAPMLAARKFPVTVINGEFDYVVGPRNSPLWVRLAAKEARNVKVVNVARAGHMTWIDQPDVFREALRAALR